MFKFHLKPFEENSEYLNVLVRFVISGFSFNEIRCGKLENAFSLLDKQEGFVNNVAHSSGMTRLRNI